MSTTPDFDKLEKAILADGFVFEKDYERKDGEKKFFQRRYVKFNQPKKGEPKKVVLDTWLDLPSTVKPNIKGTGN